MLDRTEQVDQRPTDPVDGPRHYHVELAPAGIVEQGIEPWPLVAALGAANAGVAVDLDNAPAAAFGDFLERADPILELTDGRC